MRLEGQQETLLACNPTPSMKSTRCEACRAGLHEDCDGTIPRSFDETHDRSCECSCQERRADQKRHKEPKNDMNSKNFKASLRLIAVILIAFLAAVSIVEILMHL